MAPLIPLFFLFTLSYSIQASPIDPKSGKSITSGASDPKSGDSGGISGNSASTGSISDLFNDFSDYGLSDLKLEDLPLLVPVTRNIDNSLLKDVGADKFLSLWDMYVLSGKVIQSAEPWTLLVPLNSGLSSPGFLVDKEYTKEVLLNHVSLGESIDLETAIIDSAHNPYFSLANTELVFTREAGVTFVNGIRLTGFNITTENAAVYVVESSIPVLPADYYDFIPDIDEIAPLLAAAPVKNTETPVLNPVELFFQQQTSTTTSTTTTTTTTAAPSPQTTTSSVPKPSSDVDSIQNDEPSRGTVGKTRFDKFRTREPKAQIKSQSAAKDGGLKESPDSPTRLGKSTTSSDVVKTPELPFKEEANIADFNPEDAEFGAGEFGEGELMDSELSQSSPLSAHELFEGSGKTETFFDYMTNEINRTDSIGGEFLYHFMHVNLTEELDDAENYTLILPTQSAFYDYYPIDWGFNPFEVDNFTKDVLLSHFIRGNRNLHDLPSGQYLTTLTGKTAYATKDKAGRLSIDGISLLPEMEVDFPKGRIYYIDELLFVDFERVFALRDEYPHLETASLIAFPWPGSPFLSHLLRRIENNPKHHFFTQLLKQSQISHMVSSSDDEMNRMSYTAFIPSEESLKAAFNTEDPTSVDRESASQFLLQHLVAEYLFEADLQDGLNVISLSSKIIPIKNNSDGLFIGDSRVMEPQEFLYNLGSIYYVDQPLRELSFKATPIQEIEIAPTPVATHETEESPAPSELIQEVPVMLQDAPKMFQDAPNMVQDAPKMGQETPKVPKDEPELVTDLPLVEVLVNPETPLLVFEESPEMVKEEPKTETSEVPQEIPQKNQLEFEETPLIVAEKLEIPLKVPQELQGKPLIVAEDVPKMEDVKIDVVETTEEIAGEVVTTAPEISFETRTEISFSKQINDGKIIPVSKEFVQSVKNRLIKV